MKTLKQIFANNRQWAGEMKSANPRLFRRTARGQHPGYFWIGCSDSRVPSAQITGLKPGELFVHRNVGNLVPHADVNCLSALQYAVENLRVKHVIVCGHYGCGGVLTAMEGRRHGLIDNWLHNIRDIYQAHAREMASLDDGQRFDRLCELNVVEQARNVCRTTIVQRAWDAGQKLSVHGWIYRMETGLITDLNMCVSGPEEIPPVYRLSLKG